MMSWGWVKYRAEDLWHGRLVIGHVESLENSLVIATPDFDVYVEDWSSDPEVVDHAVAENIVLCMQRRSPGGSAVVLPGACLTEDHGMSSRKRAGAEGSVVR